MYGRFEILANVVTVAFILVLTNIFIVLTTIYSRGLLAPLSIYIGYSIISRALKEQKLFDSSLFNIKNIIVVTIVLIIQYLIIRQYYALVIWFAAFSSYSYIKIILILLALYFYIFDCYLIFLLNNNYDIKKTVKLCFIAPLHSIKYSAVLIVMLIVQLVITLNSQILLLIFGITLLLLLNNIILENYYFKLK